MILAFDIGNTETAFGLFDGEELIDHWRYASSTTRTVDELGLLIRTLVRESGFDLDDVREAIIGSVVPPLTAALHETCERHLGADTVIVDARSPLPIRIDIDEPLSVGADRIVNTLAASIRFRRDTIAVDLGTATTFDCITGDGAFIGGIIAPGILTGAENLVRRTARLPRVELRRPDRVIGRRTDDALRSGIFHAAIASIDGIVRRIQDEWGRRALVVATGGLAPVLGPECETVDRVDPFLTLDGLALANRYIRRNRSRR